MRSIDTKLPVARAKAPRSPEPTVFRPTALNLRPEALFDRAANVHHESKCTTVGRWQVDLTPNVDWSTSLMSFEVAVDANKQQMVIAVGPRPDHSFLPGTDFGPNYPIYAVADDTQYQIVVTNAVSYLCADHETIKAEACMEPPA